MAEATCRRELELEILAEEVQKATERVAKEFARIARVPGFRPGKAPVQLIRQRFAEEIKSEVAQSLVPEQIEKALTEQKLSPVTRPEVEHLDFAENGSLKFHAVFEVLPEFELKQYKDLEIEVEAPEVSDPDVDKALEEMRERGAAFAPVEDRAVENGDYVQIKLAGTPVGGGDALQATNVLCHVGAEETIEAFNENLRGASVGEHKRFEVQYPADYPDAKLAGKTFHYSVEILGVKTKKLPELNDEFAKDVSDVPTLEELRARVRKNLEAAREAQQKQLSREKVLAEIVAAHEFPVPQALVERQMDARLERVVRSLAAQGVDPRAVNIDWVSLRRRQRERAIEDVKAEILLDRVAAAESLEVSEEELSRELGRLAEQSGDSAAALRARLTKQGTLDTMRSKVRSEKALDWLLRNSRIHSVAARK
jgi:trigger factor